MFATAGLLWVVIFAGLQDSGGQAAEAKPDEAKPAKTRPADVKVQALKIVETRVADFEKKSDDGFSFSFDRPGTKLTLRVKGPTAAGATHWGMLKLEGVDDQKRPVKLNEDQPSFEDPLKGFVQLDRDQMSFGSQEMSKDELRIDVALTSAPRDAKTLNLRGRLQLKVAEPLDVVVDGAPADEPVKNEALEQAGLTLKIMPRENSDDTAGFVFELSGPLDRVLDAEVVNAAGETIENNGSQRMGGGDQTQYTLWFSANPLPDDAKLKLVIAAKEEIFEASFELKDVALP
jgi:hypothetical protein